MHGDILESAAELAIAPIAQEVDDGYAMLWDCSSCTRYSRRGGRRDIRIEGAEIADGDGNALVGGFDELNAEILGEQGVNLPHPLLLDLGDQVAHRSPLDHLVDGLEVVIIRGDRAGRSEVADVERRVAFAGDIVGAERQTANAGRVLSARPFDAVQDFADVSNTYSNQAAEDDVVLLNVIRED